MFWVNSIVIRIDVLIYNETKSTVINGCFLVSDEFRIFAGINKENLDTGEFVLLSVK